MSKGESRKNPDKGKGQCQGKKKSGRQTNNEAEELRRELQVLRDEVVSMKKRMRERKCKFKYFSIIQHSNFFELLKILSTARYPNERFN